LNTIVAALTRFVCLYNKKFYSPSDNSFFKTHNMIQCMWIGALIKYDFMLQSKGVITNWACFYLK